MLSKRSISQANQLTRTITNTKRLKLDALTFNPTGGNNTGKFLHINDAAGTVDLVTNSGTVIQNVITIKLNANNALANESTTLYGAVQKAKAMSPTPDNPIGIVVYPGTYHETQPVVIDVSLITIAGFPQYYNCIFVLDAFILNTWVLIDTDVASIADITLDAQQNCSDTFEISNASNAFGIDCFRLNCLHGIRSSIWVNGGTIYNVQGIVGPSADSQYGVYCNNSGNYNANIATVWCDDYYDPSDPSNYTKNSVIYHYIDGGTMQYFNDISYGGVTFIYLTNGSSCELTGGTIIGHQVAFVLSDPSGGAGNTLLTRNITTVSCQATNNGSFTGNSWTSIADRMPFTSINYTGMTSLNTSILSLDSNTNETPGIHLFGNYIAGNRIAPSSCYLGEGGEDIHDLCIVINNVVVTSSLLRSNTSNVAFFSALTVGSVSYIGDAHPFGSVVIGMGTTAKTTGTIVCEYWNGAAWVTMNFMFGKRETPYTPYANNPFFAASEEEICRLDITKQQTASNWATTTVAGQVKYWIRFRVTVILGVNPTVQFVTLMGSTSVIKGDGSMTHHGRARSLKNIPYDSGAASASYGTISSVSIFVGNITFGRKVNNFTKGDGLSMVVLLPFDIDTSCPLSLRYAFSSDNAAASQPVFNMLFHVVNASQGDYASLLTSGSPNPTLQTLTTTITPNATNGKFMVFASIDFYLPTGLSQTAAGGLAQILFLNTVRQKTSTGLGTDDTNANNLLIHQIGLYYYSARTTGIFVQ